MNLIRKIKLIWKLQPELISLIEGINSRYNDVNEYCKKKEWKVYDNIHKTLNVIEEQKKNEIEGDTDNSWFVDRAIDVSLKTYIISNK